VGTFYSNISADLSLFFLVNGFMLIKETIFYRSHEMEKPKLNWHVKQLFLKQALKGTVERKENFFKFLVMPPYFMI
jgi:hypothetical protein